MLTASPITGRDALEHHVLSALLTWINSWAGFKRKRKNKFSIKMYGDLGLGRIQLLSLEKGQDIKVDIMPENLKMPWDVLNGYFLSEYQRPLSSSKPPKWEALHRKSHPNPVWWGLKQSRQVVEMFQGQRCYVCKDHSICKKIRTKIRDEAPSGNLLSSVQRMLLAIFIFTNVTGRDDMWCLLCASPGLDWVEEDVEEESVCQTLLCIQVNPEWPPFCTLSPCHGGCNGESLRGHLEEA